MEKFRINCKLCGNIIRNKNLKLIDEVIQDILDRLLLKLTFEDNVQYFMCSSCSDKLFAAINFKWMCLGTDNTITPKLEASAVDLKQVYVKSEGSNMLDDNQLCRLCMQLVNNKNKAIGAVQPEIFKIYIPELDFGMFFDATICEKCYDSLSTHYSFIRNCLDVDEKLRKDGGPLPCPFLGNACIKTEEIEIKTENEEEFSESRFINANSKLFEPDSVAVLRSISSRTEMYNIRQCEPQDLERTGIFTWNNNTNNKHETKTGDKYRFASDQLKQDYFSVLKLQQKNNGVDYHEASKNSSAKVDLYKCDECEYETTFKKRFKLHQIRHKDPSEIQMYKCSECKFETRYKQSLGLHQLGHKDSAEGQMHKCTECKYQTRYKINLTRHLLSHKKPSEMEMHKCGECEFETRWKRNLKLHELKHKDPSEVQMHKCIECEYETKYKKDLKVHQLKHKDPSEIQKYKCNECDHESRYKKDLVLHQLKHKDPSEVQMYKCGECKFETRYKRWIKFHQITHKDPSEVQMHECGECEYKTRYKRCIILHRLKHKDSSNCQRVKS